MNVKVIIHGGIVTCVLTDGDNVNVEIIDIDKDYDDYDALLNYEQELAHDDRLHDVSFTTANFTGN